MLSRVLKGWRLVVLLVIVAVVLLVGRLFVEQNPLPAQAAREAGNRIRPFC